MGKRKLFLVTVTLVIAYCILLTGVNAEVIERVVAIVNDDIILLSELHEAMKSSEDKGKKELEVLNEMIDRKLLLKEAERFIYASGLATYSEGDDDAIIKEYINLRIRSFIRIPFEKIEGYFKEHRESFGDRGFYDVKDEIEAILIDEAVRQRLKEHIKRLRYKAYIRIQLND